MEGGGGVGRDTWDRLKGGEKKLLRCAESRWIVLCSKALAGCWDHI